ncbi:MAG: dockerin type I domain-containing protein [Gammaproteobacteria bacterium]
MTASSGFTPFGAQADSDSDGVPDYADNCLKIPNPDQLDSDGDGYGNICDGDLNNDNMTNSLDLGLFKRAFGPTSTANDDLKDAADFNGDRRVNSLDLGTFKKLFGLPPGPSGLN